MKYSDAVEVMNMGARIKRELWDSWLIQSESAHALWDLPPYLHDEYKNRKYTPTAIDAASTDWVQG